MKGIARFLRQLRVAICDSQRGSIIRRLRCKMTLKELLLFLLVALICGSIRGPSAAVHEAAASCR